MKLCFPIIAFLLTGCLPVFSLADTLDIPIIASDDDAEEDVSGPNAGTPAALGRASIDLELHNQNGILRWVGLRFQNVGIARGARINSASIQFAASEVDFGTLTIPVFGELTPNASAFGDAGPTTKDLPVTARALTVANQAWALSGKIWDPDSLLESESRPATPDLSAIVQEVIGQSDWKAGNSMTFVFKHDPTPLQTSERLAHSFDGNPALAPVLRIDFSPSAPGDANGDGSFDFGDIEAFFLALTDPIAYAVQYSNVTLSLLDMNADGSTDFSDIDAFFTALIGG